MKLIKSCDTGINLISNRGITLATATDISPHRDDEQAGDSY